MKTADDARGPIASGSVGLGKEDEGTREPDKRLQGLKAAIMGR